MTDMADRDPLVPALTGMLVDVVWWLESCGDEEVDPDSAVKIMESVGGELLRLPSARRERLLQVLADLAEAEQDPARRDFLTGFPFAIGMVGDQESRGPGELRTRPADLKRCLAAAGELPEPACGD
ncbi:hypothetical protein OV320_4216 [Actinobacteria bacterium OV320]|nr:hypothetical protein OV320_4216 [Actinobacteria bacterium OV320]